MKRKLLSLILVAAMLASMLVFAPTSGAAVNTTTAEIAVTDATANAGGTVSVDVIVTTEKLQNGDLAFKYDATKLTPVEWKNESTGYNLPVEVLGVFAPNSYPRNGLELGLVGFGFAAGAARDASAGLAIATITFAVNANATPGDTYVEFVNGVECFVQPSSSHGVIEGANLTNKAGKITILPAGYEAAPSANPASDFEYEENDDGGLIIVGCAIESGDVIIPAEIDGLPVTAIGKQAFYNNDVASVTIPASVTTIEEMALYRLGACTAVYILGNPEIADTGIGWDGKKSSASGIMLNEDEDAALTTIYAAVGSYAETYAAIEDEDGFTLGFAEYIPATTLTYTVGDDTYTYIVGNSITAPGSAVVNGEVIVAWNDGVNNIAPGASMTIAGSTTLAPVTIKAPATQNGADVKVGATADDFALRFTSKLAIADYEKLGEIGDVQLGMLITPQKYVDYATAFTKADLAAWVVSQGYQAKDAYVDVQVNSYLSMDDNDYTIAASLKGFSTATTTKNPTFAAIAYAEITIGENVVTVYGSYDKACGRDAKTVLSALFAAGTLGTTEQGWLDTLIGKFD